MIPEEQADKIALAFITSTTDLAVDGKVHRKLVSLLIPALANIKQDIYAEGFRAGAEAMRRAIKCRHRLYPFVQAIEYDDLPLPEMPPDAPGVDHDWLVSASGRETAGERRF